MKKNYFLTLNLAEELDINAQQIGSMIERHLCNNAGYDWREMIDVVDNVEKCDDLKGKLRDSEMAAQYNNANNAMKIGELERVIDRLKDEAKEKRTEDGPWWGAALALSACMIFIGFAGMVQSPGLWGSCCGLALMVQSIVASAVSAASLCKGRDNENG